MVTETFGLLCNLFTVSDVLLPLKLPLPPYVTLIVSLPTPRTTKC